MDRKKPLVIYHANCADGFGAAYAIWLKHPDWEFHPGKYDTLPPDVTDRSVWLVDFSYKRPVIEEMLKKATRISIIDHHKSAIEDLRDLDNPLSKFWMNYDVNHSGAMLTWNWFHTEPPPQLLRHIEDRDLWKFELEGTREICAALFSYPYDFKIWHELMHQSIPILATEGMAIERMAKKNLENMIEETKRMLYIDLYLVPVANVPGYMASDAGNIMSKGHPFAATYYDTSTGRKFSLRSQKGSVDVSAVARRYGGGGHENAAGFTVGRDDALGEA
jgi:oligoribonuclease NrnB/cAMP/cGMP phosphodiesterase (DHH superfamily)